MSAHYKEINAGSPAVVEKHLKGFIWTPVVQEFQIREMITLITTI